MNRSTLPYRKNCEGYLISNNKILARDSDQGYLIFPGGGIDNNETPEEALQREALEETGAIVETNLIKLGVIRYDWSAQWAKTAKQKERYKEYRGEEMHFFVGKVKRLVAPSSREDGWLGERLMPIERAIALINASRPFRSDVQEYREMQLKCLTQIQKDIE